jgi:hypothetical protein
VHTLLRTMAKMLADGLTVQETWEEIAYRYQTDWRVRDAFVKLNQSEIGRQARDQALWSKEQWAQYGLPVPWEEAG